MRVPSRGYALTRTTCGCQAAWRGLISAHPAAGAFAGAACIMLAPICRHVPSLPLPASPRLRRTGGLARHGDQSNPVGATPMRLVLGGVDPGKHPQARLRCAWGWHPISAPAAPGFPTLQQTCAPATSLPAGGRLPAQRLRRACDRSARTKWALLPAKPGGISRMSIHGWADACRAAHTSNRPFCAQKNGRLPVSVEDAPGAP